jgi:intein-encoded DNA endonuclease-like protein
MTKPLKLAELRLEQHALELRDQGFSNRQIAVKLTEQAGATISHKAVGRYFARPEFSTPNLRT